MKLPFPFWTLNANAVVYKSELSKYSEPIKIEFFNGRVNHIKKTKQVLNAQRELIQLSGSVIIPGDIYDLPTGQLPLDMTIYVSVGGLEKRIFSVSKPDNPDGSVFSTELSF